MWCSYLEWCDVHDIMESNEFSLKVLYKRLEKDALEEDSIEGD